MWLMLQQDKPDDYILATNESHTVREFVEEACDAIGINIHWEGKGEKEKGTDMKTGKVIVRVDPQYFRPAEAHELLGDTKKARKNLKWIPKTTFSNLVKIMVSADLEKERLS
jgi:GDPmannose 4,6-dehydratase